MYPLLSCHAIGTLLVVSTDLDARTTRIVCRSVSRHMDVQPFGEAGDRGLTVIVHQRQGVRIEKARHFQLVGGQNHRC